MCIALLTTAHPDYALIVIDNRDEFILRPTSRPHWWTPSTSTDEAPSSHANGSPDELSNGHTNGTAATANETGDGTINGELRGADENGASPQILSSRDLQRREHGTWLGISRSGNFAVLTNFREDSSNDKDHPVHGQRSRGGMVTAWLAAEPSETTPSFVERMLSGPGVRGVGGFSLICGKLRRQQAHPQNGHADEVPREANGTNAAHATNGVNGSNGTNGESMEDAGIEPLAIISNRADKLAEVPWIAGRRGEVYGLSNACYDEPDIWPKVQMGKEELQKLTDEARAAKTKKDSSVTAKEKLRADLFAILDRDTLPQSQHLSFEDQIPLLKQSIFIPPIGDEIHRAEYVSAAAGGPREALSTTAAIERADEELARECRPDENINGFMTGLYGTQRQTVILVDWEGNVSFTERALWDANGNAIPRGKGDAQFDFHIDGWDNEQKQATAV